MIISQSVTGQTLLLPTQAVACGLLLAYLHLILAHSKGHGHAHLDCEYLEIGDRQGKRDYFPQIGRCLWPFDWHVYV